MMKATNTHEIERERERDLNVNISLKIIFSRSKKQDGPGNRTHNNYMGRSVRLSWRASALIHFLEQTLLHLLYLGFLLLLNA